MAMSPLSSLLCQCLVSDSRQVQLREASRYEQQTVLHRNVGFERLL